MPTPQFSANRGWSSELTGEDIQRNRNSDLMTRMALENAARQAQQARDAQAMAVQERMFNLDRQDRGTMFNRQFDADAARAAAQERMHKEGLTFQKDMFNLQDTAANKRFDRQTQIDDDRAQRSRDWQKEDFGLYNPTAAMQSEAIARIRNGNGTIQDYKIANVPMPTSMAKQARLEEIRLTRQAEDEYATEMGLPTSADTIAENQRRTKQSQLVKTAQSDIENEMGNPQLIATITSGPQAQQMMIAFKKAVENDDPVAIQNAAAGIKSHFLSKGLPAFAADKFVSGLAKQYKPSGWEQFKSFMAYPLSRPFGGGRSEGEQVVDSMIFETLQGN